MVRSGGTYVKGDICVKGKAGLDAGAMVSASQQYLAPVPASESGGAWADSLARIFVSSEFKKQRTPSQLLQQLKSPVLCPVESTLRLLPSLIQVLA